MGNSSTVSRGDRDSPIVGYRSTPNAQVEDLDENVAHDAVAGRDLHGDALSQSGPA